MAQSPDDNLLARLAGHVPETGGSNPWDSLAATEPDYEEQLVDQPQQEARSGTCRDETAAEPEDPALEALVQRVQRLAARRQTDRDAESASADWGNLPADEDEEVFVPIEPESLEEAGLTDSEVEALILKFLLARGDAIGRDIAEQVKLPFVLVDRLLRELKAQQLVVHRGGSRNTAPTSAPHRSRWPTTSTAWRCNRSRASIPRPSNSPQPLTTCCSAPRCSIGSARPSTPGAACFSMVFLYGPPGNGKTSIAERITAAFGPAIWMPRAITVDGEIIRLFDPVNHEEAPLDSAGGIWDGRKIDKRWVRVRRPTILAGGELTMSQLEVTVNTATGICEAPLQLKSNCGTLVIDDFGRQRVQIDELLNRWIVPLENRYDFLNLPNGKKIRVPFDQLIIFSTNLEPRDLVDEAFLRRIPYKIEVLDPTEQQFRELFERLAPQMGIQYQPEAVDYLIEHHYRRTGRPMRFCHPRDLLMQVRNYCT